MPFLKMTEILMINLQAHPEAVMGLLPGRKCGEILDVCKREAEIRGNSVDGFDIFYLTEE